jgi:hypothetical protein
MVLLVICRDCARPMAVLRTTASAPMTVRSHVCECGQRWESVEKITRRLTATGSTPAACRQPTDSAPVTRGQQTGSVRGVGGVLSSDPNSVLFPLPSVPSEQSGSVLGSDLKSDRAKGPQYTDAFRLFWDAYPRKTAKGAAWKAWPPAAAHLEAILDALAWQRLSADWQRDGGAYVPHPATWLNARRWEDEPAEAQPAIPEKARVSRAAGLAWLERKEKNGG